MAAGPRADGSRVALKVERSQAASILEEWSSAGTERLQEAVASRNWRSVESKRGAFDVARALDVMMDSGLCVTREPAGEVLLRALAAAWFADRHQDAQTAEFLRESSMANFGVPRGLLDEARAMRKLASSAGADQ